MAFDYAEVLETMNEQVGSFEANVDSLVSNKGFIAFRRFMSGSDIWKATNRFIGVLNVFQHYRKQMNNTNKEFAKHMKNLTKMKKQIKELDFSFPIAGANNLFDVIDKITDTSGNFDINEANDFRRSMGINLDRDMRNLDIETADAMPLYKDLRDEGYNQREALESITKLLKPLIEQQKKIKRHSKQQLQLAQATTPLEKRLLKYEHMKENMRAKWAKFDVKAFGGFIKAGVKWFAAIVIGLFLLRGFIKNSSIAFKGVWDIIVVLFGAAAFFFSKMLEGIGLIYEGIMAGDIIMAVKGFIYVLGGLLLGVISVGLSIIAAVILGGLALIFGGFVEWMFNAQRDSEMLLSGLLQIGSMIGILIAGFLWFWSMSWIPLLVIAIIAGVLSIMVGKHASGGIVNSPLQLVGEKGPELVSLPMGSRVHTNSVSNKMMAGNTINVHINGRVGASDAEIRDIANKVAKEINLRMTRTGASGMGF